MTVGLWKGKYTKINLEMEEKKSMINGLFRDEEDYIKLNGVKYTIYRGKEGGIVRKSYIILDKSNHTILINLRVSRVNVTLKKIWLRSDYYTTLFSTK